MEMKRLPNHRLTDLSYKYFHDLITEAKLFNIIKYDVQDQRSLNNVANCYGNSSEKTKNKPLQGKWSGHHFEESRI